MVKNAGQKEEIITRRKEQVKLKIQMVLIFSLNMLKWSRKENEIQRMLTAIGSAEQN